MSLLTYPLYSAIHSPHSTLYFNRTSFSSHYGNPKNISQAAVSFTPRRQEVRRVQDGDQVLLVSMVDDRRLWVWSCLVWSNSTKVTVMVSTHWRFWIRLVRIGFVYVKGFGFSCTSRNLVLAFMLSVSIYRPRGTPTNRPCVLLKWTYEIKLRIMWYT